MLLEHIFRAVLSIIEATISHILNSGNNIDLFFKKTVFLSNSVAEKKSQV